MISRLKKWAKGLNIHFTKEGIYLLCWAVLSHSVMFDFVTVWTIACQSPPCTPGFPVHHHILELAQTHVHWVGDAIQLSCPVIPFSSCPQSFPASGSFLKSQLFASGGQSIGASASFLPVNMYYIYIANI